MLKLSRAISVCVSLAWVQCVPRELNDIVEETFTEVSASIFCPAGICTGNAKRPQTPNNSRKLSDKSWWLRKVPEPSFCLGCYTVYLGRTQKGNLIHQTKRQSHLAFCVFVPTTKQFYIFIGTPSWSIENALVMKNSSGIRYRGSLLS